MAGDFKNGYSQGLVEKTITALFMSFDEILFRGEDLELEKAISFLQEFVTFLKYGLKRD